MKNKIDAYRDWQATDANVRAVADDPTAFSIMRALAREVLSLRKAAGWLAHHKPGTPVPDWVDDAVNGPVKPAPSAPS